MTLSATSDTVLPSERPLGKLTINLSPDLITAFLSNVILLPSTLLIRPPLSLPANVESAIAIM